MTVIDFSLPSSSIDVSTPEGLLEVLRRGVFKPYQSQFEGVRDDGEKGLCCLGVYAKTNGIKYHQGAGIFHRANADFANSTDPTLPAGHWLLTPVQVIDDLGRWEESTLQSTLANANDRDTSDAYEGPISVLEAFISGCRSFDISGRESVKPVW